YQSYATRTDPWTCLGRTPIRDARVPNAVLTWRVEKPGFETAYDMSGGGIINSATGRAVASVALGFTLQRTDAVPPGMVYVTAGDDPFQILIPGLDHLPT